MQNKIFNKLSPRTLIVLVSLLLASFISTVDLFFEISWQHFVSIFLLTFFSSSLLLYYAVEVYLRNRIKLVYKIIHQENIRVFLVL